MAEEKKDLISSLPNDILWTIMSFLPFKSAVKTTILSARWKNLWNKALLPRGGTEDIEKFITAFVERVDNRPHWIPYQFGQDDVLLASIDDKELHLHFSCKKQEIPTQFNWLIKLDHQHQLTTHRPFASVLFSLKVLHLTSVNRLTEQAVSSLISNCGLLESLTITECKGLQALRIGDSSSLQSLTVLDCPQVNNLYIYAHMLHTFQFRGLLPWIWLKGPSQLVDVMFDFRGGLGYHSFSRENLLSLLLALANVEVLTLCGWIFQVPIQWWLSSARAIWDRGVFLFNNLKELWWIDGLMVKDKMDSLVSILKICPKLERLFITIDPASYCYPVGEEECYFWIGYSNRVASDRRLNHLKIVQMEGLMNQNDGSSLAEHLLKEVVPVQRMIAPTLHENESNGNCSHQLFKILHGTPLHLHQAKTRHKNERKLMSESSTGYQGNTTLAVEYLQIGCRCEYEEEDYRQLFTAHCHMGL